MEFIVIFALIAVIIFGGMYLYSQYENEQERKAKDEADKSLINAEVQQIKATIGAYDGYAMVRDTDNRFVGFFFYDRLKQVKIISARLNKLFDLPYDNIIDCKAFTETIVGNSKTTAKTRTDYTQNLVDPNATVTEFKTTKEPDTTFHIINITTSDMSAPLISFIGEYEDIYKLEALIKIIIRNRQS